MPSARTTSTRPASSSLADATAKTRSLVEDLQARLTTRPYEAEKPAAKTVDVIAVASTQDEIQYETEEELEQQLQAYFERTMPAVSTKAAAADDLRSRVIEGVVDRVLADWTNPQQSASAAALKREVIDRLVERVLEQFHKPAEGQRKPT